MPGKGILGKKGGKKIQRVKCLAVTLKGVFWFSVKNYFQSERGMRKPFDWKELQAQAWDTENCGAPLGSDNSSGTGA